MKGFDAFAGVIKSGGKTRRAAKMVILNADHPDIVDFINCKVEEEKKAWALIDAGYDGSFTGTAYGSVFFQNSNNSVRASDEFMRAVLDDGEWQTKSVTTSETMDTYRARDLMRLIAEGTWVCGDPGMQFDTTVNEWHTCPNTARINASNPCSEYMFLDDSACNLASINLMKFVAADGEFDVESFRAACRTLITAQEIMVDNSSYPTKADREEQPRLPSARAGLRQPRRAADVARPALRRDSGRAYAGAITALMTGEAYAQSARVARDHGGPFAGYDDNRQPFLRVMRKHRDAVKDTIDPKHVPTDLHNAAKQAWDDAVELGEDFGYRNAQATVLAPTGTIGFMMDCDTTGIEPDIALIKYKKLVGGGMMKIVNQTVPDGAQAPGLHRRRRLTTSSSTSTSTRPSRARRTCWSAPAGVRLRLQGGAWRAVHPLHGPHQDDGRDPAVHLGRHQQDGERPQGRHGRGHRAGLPGNLASRRQGDLDLPRRLQAHAAAQHLPGCEGDRRRARPKELIDAAVAQALAARAPHAPQAAGRAAGDHPQVRHLGPRGLHHGGPVRGRDAGRDLPGHGQGRLDHLGLRRRVRPGHQLALQYGVPLQALVDKFSHVRFEPSGMTRNPDVRFAKSIVDYIFRWMASKFLSPEAQFRAGVNNRDEAEGKPQAALEIPAPKVGSAETVTATVTATRAIVPSGSPIAAMQNQEDAPPCTTCGSIMVRSGSCYKCSNCGTTSGCA